MIYLLALTVILLQSVAAAQECRPPPYRHDMSVVYGRGFIEYRCPNRASSYQLKCENGRWQGFVPESCDYYVRPTAPPTRPPPPPTVPSRPTFSSNCGPPPHRDDMLYYSGAGGAFVDYYCKPPEGGFYQPFTYRLMCKFGKWFGDLPSGCPKDLSHYPKPNF